MNFDRWQEERDPVRLMMKLQEEVGEVQHAFNRGDEKQFLEEMEHVQFIRVRLHAEVIKWGIPDTRGVVYSGNSRR